MKTIKIILIDIMDKNGLICRDYILEGLVTYLMYKNIRMFFIKDGVFYSEGISRKIRKNEIDYAVINDIKSSDFFEENREYDFTKYFTYEITDPILDSLRNKIPLDRLVYNYNSIYELPDQYLDLLDQIYFDIKNVLDFLMNRKYIEIKHTNEKHLHAHKIREFLNRELN